MSTPPPQTATPHTPESARRALPLLRSIARDAHATYLRLQGGLRQQDARRPLEDLSGDAGLPEELREDLAALRDQVRELAELGARLGDPELGIVLLDAIVDGRAGSICWKIGESSIRYWYPLGGRYEDRRPIPAA